MHAGLNLRVPYNAGNLLTILGNISFTLHGVSWLVRRISMGQANQAKVLTGGGDLREAQVDVPLSVSHSCV